MLHHISICAHNPSLVAGVLAEILQGTAFPFPPVTGGYVTLCDDEYATLVEVYPIGTEMVPDQHDGGIRFRQSDNNPDYGPVHAAFSVAVDEARIKEIAAREGWQTAVCDRGGVFRVIEFWIENRLLFELLTPDMARDYRNAMTSDNWRRFIDQTEYGPFE